MWYTGVPTVLKGLIKEEKLFEISNKIHLSKPIIFFVGKYENIFFFRKHPLFDSKHCPKNIIEKYSHFGGRGGCISLTGAKCIICKLFKIRKQTIFFRLLINPESLNKTGSFFFLDIF